MTVGGTRESQASVKGERSMEEQVGKEEEERRGRRLNLPQSLRHLVSRGCLEDHYDQARPSETKRAVSIVRYQISNRMHPKRDSVDFHYNRASHVAS